MQTADFDMADFEDRAKGDRNALVRFFIRPVLDETESAKEGRPIYRDKEYVEIHVPGNQTNIPVKPVDQIIKRRFATQYQKWKASGESSMEVVSGTHLTEVPWLNRSQVEELAYFHIRTLEQLAEVSDSVCGKVMGLYELKRRAKLVLDASKDASVITKLEEERNQMVNQIEVMQRTIEDLTERLAKLEED